jgi:hypothetical protein
MAQFTINHFLDLGIVLETCCEPLFVRTFALNCFYLFESMSCLNSKCDLDYICVECIVYVNYNKMSCMIDLLERMPFRPLVLLQV